MNRGRQEFIDRWKRFLAGGYLFGCTATHKSGPLSRAEAVFEITTEVQELLGRMWDDDEAAKPAPPPPDSGNGTKTPATGATNGRTDQAEAARGPQARGEGTPQARR